MGKGLDDLADIDEVDLLVGSVNVGLRAANTKRNDLGSRVFALKFLKEGDRTAFSECANLLATEVLL